MSGSAANEGAILSERNAETGGGEALARVRTVLVRTTHPGNIGASARAIKTMGLARMALVAPQFFPDPQADAMAAGAAHLLTEASVHASLDEALAGTTLAIAITARRRGLSHVALDAREAARVAVEEARSGGEVALVFGPEMSGLANDEVIRCQRIAHIAASPDFSSLNLAAAVQVMAYEIRMAALGPAVTNNERFEAATFDDIEVLYAHFERNLRASGFLDPAQPKRLMKRLRRLFGRTRLEREEVNLLHGILTAWDGEGRRQQ
jgi:tRNA/rRNA methyltransferase